VQLGMSAIRRPSGPDVLLAGVVALLAEIGSTVTLTDDVDVYLSPPGTSARLLLVSAALVLVLRRVAPLPVLLLTMTASLLDQALGHRPAPLPLGVVVALFTVAVALRPVYAGWAAGLYSVAVIVGSALSLTSLDDDHVYVYLVAVAAAVTVGYGIALARTRASLAEQHSAELAREQDERIRQAREEEQARIAREVHDIVAHNVSVMVAQASAASRAVRHGGPDAARMSELGGTLGSIEAVGRDALEGLRRLMDLLRTEPDGPDDPTRPDLGRLGQLVEQVRRAGLPVDLEVRGKPLPLSAAVELNAYRIVQESLTNVMKHAGPARATIVVHYRQDALEVEVRNTGRNGDAGARGGYGIAGMQQRAAAMGGELVAGPAGDDGFRVSARLPLPGGVR
jgi:signal transduction histidine kinase